MAGASPACGPKQKPRENARSGPLLARPHTLHLPLQTLSGQGARPARPSAHPVPSDHCPQPGPSRPQRHHRRGAGLSLPRHPHDTALKHSAPIPTVAPLSGQLLGLSQPPPPTQALCLYLQSGQSPTHPAGCPRPSTPQPPGLTAASTAAPSPALQPSLQVAARASQPPGKSQCPHGGPHSLRHLTLASLTSSRPRHASPCCHKHLLTPAACTAPPAWSTETPSALSPRGPRTPTHRLARQHGSLGEGPSSPTFQDRQAEKEPQRPREPLGRPVHHAPDRAPGAHAHQESSTDEATTGVRTHAQLCRSHTR